MAAQKHGKGARKSSTLKNRSRELGQGMTEYIIIVALIAIGTIGVITVFGNNIRALFGASAQALAGETNVDVETQTDVGSIEKNLEDFAQQDAAP